MDLDKIKNHRGRVILQFAIPSIIAMVLTSMINIVDGYFIGNYVGTEGLAAVNLGLPIVYLYLAVGLMIAVGGISIAGRLLGAGKIENSNQVFRQTIVLCFVVSFALTVVMFLILKPVSLLFHADALTREYFISYYGIMIFQLPLMVIISALGMFIRGEGNPVFVMITNLITVVLNIITDYIFAGPLSLGVAGVALASLISTAIVLVISIMYITCRSNIFRFGKYNFDKGVLKETIFNGSSEFIGELAMCISMTAYNYIVLKTAGVEGLAAFTIIGYVSYVFNMIIIGFGQGIVPIISFSYGAKQGLLSRLVRNTTIKMVAGAAIVTFVVMARITGWYCGFFSDSNNVSQIVGPGLRLQMSSFAIAGFNTIASFYFTAIGKAKESAVISASRGLVVLMIAIVILPKLLGITGIWLVSLTTELVTLIISILYMKKNTMEESYAA
jgi:Na+-driven multidrug efflux pump